MEEERVSESKKEFYVNSEIEMYKQEIQRLSDVYKLTVNSKRYRLGNSIYSKLSKVKAMFKRKKKIKRDLSKFSISSHDLELNIIAPKRAPLVSIIMITYNNLEYSKLCIHSVIENTEYSNYELIIVDNMSQDGSQEYLKTLENPRIKVILNHENSGFAKGNNIGIKQAKGEYILLLNNDTIVTPGWLSNMVVCMEENQEFGALSPVTNSARGKAKLTVNPQSYSEIIEFSKKQYHSNAGIIYDKKVYVLIMYCIMIRKSVLEEIGLLDEKFGLGMLEDDDFSLRIRKAGYKLGCAEGSYVHHFGSVSFSALGNTTFHDIKNKNKVYYEEKWGIPWIFELTRDEEL